VRGKLDVVETALQTNGDWLAGCIGYVVEADAGRIGRLEAVRRNGAGRPVALVVRTGRAGRLRLLVPVDDIAGVLPSSHLIVLVSSWTLFAEDGPDEAGEAA